MQKTDRESKKFRMLGHLIKDHRLAAGLTQTELIEKLKYNPKPTKGFLSHVENGRRRPKPEMLQALAATFGLSHGKYLELLIAADYGLPTEDSFSMTNIMMKTLLHSFDSLSNEQDLIRDMATAIFMNQVKDLVILWGNYSQGRTALYEGELERSLQALSQASDRNQKLYKATDAYIEDARGEICYRQGQIAQALKHFSDAFKHAQDIEDPYLIGLTIIHLGDIARIRGDWNEALALYERAREIFLELNDQDNMNLAQRNATTIYLFRGLIPDSEDTTDVPENAELLTTAKKHMFLKNDQLLSWQLSLEGQWDIS